MIIKVRHTVQMGHRLWRLPGKCQNLHGHTWTVILSLEGVPNDDGILVDYHDVKDWWRPYLDSNFDHRFVFENTDPLMVAADTAYYQEYPGSAIVSFHPTVENLAQYWAVRAHIHFDLPATVELWEGDNNCAVATAK